MEFNYRYAGKSSVATTASASQMSFAPDTLRDPTYFRGKLRSQVGFREAISALHDVVVSDHRFTPRDLSEYTAWLRDQEDIWVGERLSESEALKGQIAKLRAELSDMRAQSSRIMGPFYKARSAYWKYLYHKNRALWIILDPVITVHPDQLFFECFSRDESSYGKLSCSYNVFQDVGEFACGTTNIDYSDTLYNEFQKIRNYKETELEVDPSGFDVHTTHEDRYREQKIELPDSWVRGFLQVSSAMTLDATRITLHPMDVHNFCFVLRRLKEKKGPRSMRYCLRPGHPVQVRFEPWNLTVDCPRSIYHGTEEKEIRVWGRRRLLILERLIPLARSFTVQLLGSGMPSFYIADLGEMNFTLGLSGWTVNDWSRAGQFDLLAPRKAVDAETATRIFEALKESWFASADDLSNRLGLERDVILGALGTYTQAGRVIYDIQQDVYRARELSREPLPMEQLRFANDREASASRLAASGAVKARIHQSNASGTTLHGTVTIKNRTYHPELRIDADERLVSGTCDCNFFLQNKLRQGPCECMLATRMIWRQHHGD